MLLALDHSRQAPWGPLHGVSVSCFLLQHPSRLPRSGAVRAWEIVHAYLTDGLSGVTRLTDRARRNNSHRTAAPGLVRPMSSFPPPGAHPVAYDTTIADVAQGGRFPADGFPLRVAAWAEATVTAWDRFEGRRANQ